MAQIQPKVTYVKPQVFLKLRDQIYYNPELKIIKSTNITLTLVNCDGPGGYSKDYIIEGENISIKKVNRIKNSYCVMRTIEIEPKHSDEPALVARVKEVYGNRQKTVVMQTYLYYRGKWYVFTYSF